VFMRRSVRPKSDCEKTKSKEKSPSRFISRIRGSDLIQPIAMEVRTIVTVTNTMKLANFNRCLMSVEEFGFCAELNIIKAFSIERHTTLSCTTALACD
jgi:hypothetical protein